MSYGVKFRCTHKAKTNQTETTFKIDILKDGYSGAVTEVLGFGDVFEFEYEKIDPTKLHGSPIQSGRLEFKYLVRDATDYELLTDIFDNDEGTFKMRLYRDDALLFEGFVLNDMLEISEADYPHESKIIAKDFTKLKGRSYGLTADTTFVTVSSLIEDLISPIRDGRTINYFTSFANSNVSGSFVDGVFVDKFGIRDFKDVESRTDDLALDRYDILESLLKTFGLLIRQAEGEFQVYQLSGLSALPTTTVDSSTSYILPSSITQFNAGIKRAKFAYNHRTVLKEIKMPDKFFLLYDSDTESVEQGLAKNRAFSQLYNSDQDIRLKFRVDSDFPIPTTATGDLQDFTDLSNRFGRFQIKIVASANTYYWKLNDTQNAQIFNAQGSWVTEETTNAIRLIGGGQIEGTNLQRYSNVLDLDITDAPAPADGNLTITFFNSAKADMNNGRVQEFILPSTETHIFVNDFAIEGEDNKSNSETLAYEIEQDGDFSNVYDHGSVLFGEGPVTYSPLALFYDDGGTKEPILGGWNRGSGTTKTLAELLLEEIIGIQSRGTKNLSADFYGNYNGHNKLLYNSIEYFFIGGSLNGNNIFRANFIELNFQTATLGDLSEVADAVRASSFNGTTSADVVGFREAVKLSEFFNSIFLSNFVGELSTAIEAGSTITSFVANLSAQIRDGEDFVLVDKANEKPYHVSVVGDYNAGQNVTVTIDEQYIATDLPVGSPIILSGGLLESYFTVDPSKLLISVQSRDEISLFGKVNESFSGGETRTTFEAVNENISATNPVVLKDNQEVRLRREDGESQILTVNGNQNYTSSPFTITFDSFETDFLGFGVNIPQFAKYKCYIEPFNQGSSVASIDIKADANEASITSLTSITNANTTNIASVTQRVTTAESEIDSNTSILTTNGLSGSTNITQRTSIVEGEVDTVNSQIVLKADAQGNISAVRLDAGPDGSNISITADDVNINNINFNSAGGTISSNNYSEGVSGWEINGLGEAEFSTVTIRGATSSIGESAKLVDLDVTGTLTMNTGGEVTNSGGDYVLDDDGLRMEAVSAGVQGNPNAIRFVSTTGTAVAEMRAFKEAIVVGIDIFDEHTLQLKATNGSPDRDRIRLDADIVLISNDLDVSGDIECTTLTETSDRYQKENIEDIGPTLDKIIQLSGKRYDMLGPSTTKNLGLLAQDVEELFPEVVRMGSGTNQEGERIQYKTLSYTQLIPALIESIKELKQEIDQLKNEQGI
jgi:hypothetical protein